MLDGIPLLVPSAYGLIALIVLEVLRGDLVPRRILEQMRKDHDARMAEAQAVTRMWREAWEVEHEANGQLLDEHGKLSLETARTGIAVARAVAAPAVEGDPDANPSAVA